MMQALNSTGVIALLVAVAAGCSGSGPVLVDAGGTVTYLGKPIEGATVTFLPTEGPVATGKTDAAGKFTLSTAGRKGVVVGNAKVSIEAYPPVDPEEVAEFSEMPSDHTRGDAREAMHRKMIQRMQTAAQQSSRNASASESLIPTKYRKFETSGLTATVTNASKDNQFSFELE